jgi:hypothetical protein
MAQMDKQIQYYEDEIRVLREQIANGPRNFTDKSVTSAEYQDMRLKVCYELENKCKTMHLDGKDGKRTVTSAGGNASSNNSSTKFRGTIERDKT